MTQAPDLESISWVRFLVATVTVVGLLGLLGVAMKTVADRGWLVRVKRPERRLKIVESLPLDSRWRLVIVQCDDTEHLLLLGPGQDRLVDTIRPSPSPAKSRPARATAKKS